MAIPPSAEAAAALLEAERARHRARASRFGTAFVDPARAHPAGRALDRRARLTRPGFASGVDILDPAEQARLAARAARFGAQAGAGPRRPDLPTLPDPADEAAKKARAARFGGTYTAPDATGQMAIDLVAPRTDAHLATPRRPDALHLYGVDTLSSADCMRYFSAYGPTFVEWINDSSCNVLFADAGSASRALVGTGVALPGGGGGAGADTPPVDMADKAAVARSCWHRGPDFRRAGQAEGLPLLFRMAAITDVRPPREAGGVAPSRRLWQDGGGGRRKGGVRKQQQQGPPRRRRVVEQVEGGGGGGGGGGGDVAMAEADRVVVGVDPGGEGGCEKE